MGSSGPFAPSPTSVSTASLAPQLQQVDTSAARPLHRRDKWKRTVEFNPVGSPIVNLESIMAATRGAAREAQAEQVGLERRTEIAAS